MTVEDSIEVIRQHCRSIDSLQGYHNKAYDMAIEALEKQIPKKTIPQHDFLQEYEICPVCNRNWGIMVNYCPECGQRLER